MPRSFIPERPPSQKLLRIWEPTTSRCRWIAQWLIPGPAAFVTSVGIVSFPSGAALLVAENGEGGGAYSLRLMRAMLWSLLISKL